AQVALRESEQRFRMLAQASFEGICLSENGRILDINDQFITILGYTRQELIGREIVGLVAPEWQGEVKRRVEAGEEGTFEHRGLRKDGSSFDAEAHSRTMTIGQRKVRVTALRDITERKRIQSELEHSLSLLRATLESTADGILAVDAAGKTILGYNRRFREMWQVPEEILQRGDDTVLQQFTMEQLADPAAFVAKVQALYGQPEAESLDILEFKSGRIVERHSHPQRVGDKIVGRVWSFRDLTEQRRMDDKLRQLSQAVEQSPISVMITDRSGNIQYVNRKFSEVTGYPFEEVFNRNPRFLKSGELSGETYRELWTRIHAGGTWSGELHNRKKNGELFWEWASISPIFDSTGNVTHFLAVKEDISERKQLEEQLRQSQKMDAFGQLAGGVAHDFNNLLTVIQGNVALLTLQDSVSPDFAAGLSEIDKAADRAANLTRQLLTFSRRQLFKPAALDLNEVVATTTKMLQRLIGEHIILQTRFVPGGAPVMADRNMVDQILVNLAVNSRDAMPRGGHLIIQTAAATITESDSQANPKARAGVFIRLSVTDTGTGIPPEQIERIFEPFFTTKEVGKGTGLGLATVFGIIEQHGGWIDVNSRVDHGTTFHLYLPRFMDATRPAPETPGEKVDGRGNETILLVEDEAPVRTLTRRMLERNGYRVIEADSGVTALQLWPQHRDAVALLLTDMLMPGGISGRDLAEQLLRDTPGLKVIYSSGYTDDILGEDSPLRHNGNFLEKPFELQKLLQMVRHCLDGKPRPAGAPDSAGRPHP
ncbi:MAG TPA: PAS domain S-box protein, partial [Verrucomicrobiae bacterium]|nr:PAS domain S-box protein [Verrucomicrobiae bacterium]